jgi:hypothetical protein
MLIAKSDDLKQAKEIYLTQIRSCDAVEESPAPLKGGKRSRSLIDRITEGPKNDCSWLYKF